MGCVCNKVNRDCESEVFTDLEWSHRGEHIRKFVQAEARRSCIEKTHYTLSFDKGHNEISSVITEGLSKTTSSTTTKFVSKVRFREPTMSTTSTLNSASSYWKNIGDIMSFDGVNKRICNRYEIGLRMLKAQIQVGADPNVLTTHGDRTCLMFGVLAEDFSFVKQLVALGVDVNKTNRFGETALSFALGLEREDIASYLRLNGAVEGVS